MDLFKLSSLAKAFQAAKLESEARICETYDLSPEDVQKIAGGSENPPK